MKIYWYLLLIFYFVNDIVFLQNTVHGCNDAGTYKENLWEKSCFCQTALDQCYLVGQILVGNFLKQ